MTDVSALNAQARRLLSRAPLGACRSIVEINAGIQASRARETDRVNRLVLGRPRPLPVVDATGLNKQERKAARDRVNRAHRKLIKADREFTGKAGTPETLRHVAAKRLGSLARLLGTGQLDQDQWNAAEAIIAVHTRVTGDVTIAIASMEARVDRSPQGDGTFYEALGAVRAEVAYTKWRADLPKPHAVLAMIVDDVPYTVAAADHGMSARRAKKLLLDALDHWWSCSADARKEVDPATLAAAQAGIF